MQGAASTGAPAAQALEARKKAIAAIEEESTTRTGLRSDVVTLYQGGEYQLYRYKKYTDVRLVFAPEQQIAFFGGDPDNFNYPRYDLDMALFRVYENGKPVEPRLPEVDRQGRGRRRAGVRLRPSRVDRSAGHRRAARDPARHHLPDFDRGRRPPLNALRKLRRAGRGAGARGGGPCSAWRTR